ncbi:MAG: SWIM zinc finger domain-containing protein [Actinomycetota bacterium]|nr:SWIM zinc finger domain-containing protein [Actinomycetota bacterium]
MNYRAESCDCPDFLRRGVCCKHVYAVGIHRAKRRGQSARRLGL